MGSDVNRRIRRVLLRLLLRLSKFVTARTRSCCGGSYELKKLDNFVEGGVKDRTRRVSRRSEKLGRRGPGGLYVLRPSIVN